jgi:hypothetical protein
VAETLSDVPLAEPVEPTIAGVWRHGKLLVMHKGATLPDRCVKSNRPAGGRRLRRDLHWIHPVVYLAFLGSPLVFIILYALLRKHAVIEIGLSAEWFAKRRRVLVVSWVLILASAVTVFVALATAEGAGTPYTILTGVALLCAGLIYGTMGARTVAATMITDDYVWLKGVHAGFLAELPAWRHLP